MKKWTVIWQPSDIDDFEYSYVDCYEPFDWTTNQLHEGVQNSNYEYSDEQDDYKVICVIEGHVGVNFP